MLSIAKPNDCSKCWASFYSAQPTRATNWYYQNDKDHQVDGYSLLWEATKGAGVGGGVKALEERKVVVKTIVNSKESIMNFFRNLGENNGVK